MASKTGTSRSLGNYVRIHPDDQVVNTRSTISRLDGYITCGFLCTDLQNVYCHQEEIPAVAGEGLEVTNR